MFSDNKKPPIKCWILPASPQCGLKTNVFSPRSLFVHSKILIMLKYVNYMFNILPQLVQDAYVGIHIVYVVVIWRVLGLCPVVGTRNVPVQHRCVFILWFIVHRIKSGDILKELVKVRMFRGTNCGLKQWHEYICQHLFKVIHQLVRFVYVTKFVVNVSNREMLLIHVSCVSLSVSLFVCWKDWQREVRIKSVAFEANREDEERKLFAKFVLPFNLYQEIQWIECFSLSLLPLVFEFVKQNEGVNDGKSQWTERMLRGGGRRKWMKTESTYSCVHFFLLPLPSPPFPHSWRKKLFLSIHSINWGEKRMRKYNKRWRRRRKRK